jgi:hypothetical protein
MLNPYPTVTTFSLKLSEGLPIKLEAQLCVNRLAGPLGRHVCVSVPSLRGTVLFLMLLNWTNVFAIPSAPVFRNVGKGLMGTLANRTARTLVVCPNAATSTSFAASCKWKLLGSYILDAQRILLTHIFKGKNFYLPSACTLSAVAREYKTNPRTALNRCNAPQRVLGSYDRLRDHHSQAVFNFCPQIRIGITIYRYL